MTAPFTGVDEHVTRLEGHFHRIDHHFDRIDQHFDRIDQHFDRIERRFDRSEQRSDLNCRGLEHRLLAALDRNLSDMLNRQMRTLVISQLAAVVAIVALAFVSG